MKRDCPTAIGNTTTAIILSALVKAGVTVSVPFGDGHAYDLVVDIDNKLLRAQCKTGRVRRGNVVANLYTIDRARKQHGYSGKADVFAIHCAETDKIYLVPVEECSTARVYLRISTPLNKQAKLIRWAMDYELKSNKSETSK